MRFLKLVRIGSIVLLATTAVACGGDDNTTAADPASDDRVTTTAAPAGDDTVAQATPSDADCPAAKDALSKLTVNWQLVVQLPRTTDVAEWPRLTSTVGTVAEFGDQLDTLAAAFASDADAADAVAYMQGANDIVEQGLGGDTTAPAELATYLGDDLATALGKKTPLLMAGNSLTC